MQIVQVSTRQGRRFIPVKGWDSVTKALNTFANGYTRGAKATEQVTVDDIGKTHGTNGGMAVGMFLLGGAIVGGRSKLVENLLTEAKQRLKQQTEFRKSYDYDGIGTPFFKTSVDIKVLDREQDMYGIGLNAAYVGDEPEQGLAEHFSIPRTLLSCLVEVETKPMPGNRFEFDFEPIVRKLDSVLDTKKITGEQIARAMLVKDDDYNPTFVLQNKDGLEVRIQPGRVERRMKYTRGTGLKDTWTVKDSVFSGELKRDFHSEDENVKATPTLLIVVSSMQKDNYSSFPIWQPEEQQKAIDLTTKIVAALQ
jgi:hypothetical protein